MEGIKLYVVMFELVFSKVDNACLLHLLLLKTKCENDASHAVPCV